MCLKIHSVNFYHYSKGTALKIPFFLLLKVYVHFSSRMPSTLDIYSFNFSSSYPILSLLKYNVEKNNICLIYNNNSVV